MRVATSAPGAGRTALSVIFGCGRHSVGLGLRAASTCFTAATPSTPAADTINLTSTSEEPALFYKDSSTHRTAMRVAASAPGTSRTALSVIFG